ncbi:MULTISPECIES: PQQ-binding-like beta-propeller repeat protein [unclassified Actinopolyspora]|uniref:Rv3212 family protein n=1 Tax=unclassified Actinopolyspora TaxID=2639451 RepID=UPI0013F649E4|nr:hypothetical protein [Actinopolyspora sp. BKK2]NHE77835.1 hypothetical protein [Actinopolyspora sp. BKK1]
MTLVRPERRTKGDIATALVLTIAVLGGAVTLWWFSSARATELSTASEPVSPASPARTVPERVEQVWQAPSSATPHPVLAGPTVVTGQDGEVLGRDPASGDVRWRYSRDKSLCTVGAEWERAIAVYRTGDHCNAVTSLNGSDGSREPQRNSGMSPGTRLLSDGNYVTATGSGFLETWRSDLVRTQQYGIPTDIKIPDNNLRRPDCDYSGTAVGDRRVAVIAECADSPGDRVTVLKAHPEDNEQPEEVMSTVLSSERASVVAVTGERVAVALRDRQRLAVYDMSGALRESYAVRLGELPDSGANVHIEPTTRSGDVYWYTGRDTVALEGDRLTPVWTARDTLGPATRMADELLLPVRDGLAVHDPASGERLRTLALDRAGDSRVVFPEVVGRTVLEQRGDRLFAYR